MSSQGVLISDEMLSHSDIIGLLTAPFAQQEVLVAPLATISVKKTPLSTYFEQEIRGLVRELSANVNLSTDTGRTLLGLGLFDLDHFALGTQSLSRYNATNQIAFLNRLGLEVTIWHPELLLDEQSFARLRRLPIHSGSFPAVEDPQFVEAFRHSIELTHTLISRR